MSQYFQKSDVHTLHATSVAVDKIIVSDLCDFLVVFFGPFLVDECDVRRSI